MSYSKTNERLAINLREKINTIRDTNEEWMYDEDVIEMIEEIESVGYFYDEDSWDVYANEDEYFDETPLDLYVDDEYDEDEEFDIYSSGRSKVAWGDEDDDF